MDSKDSGEAKGTNGEVLFTFAERTKSVSKSTRELEEAAKDRCPYLEQLFLEINQSTYWETGDCFAGEEGLVAWGLHQNSLSFDSSENVKGVSSFVMIPPENEASQLEIAIDRDLNSIDVHHAHFDSNCEEIEYLGQEIDELLESM